ncbi:MAG: hypothetical protein J6Y15_04210, partial [Bacteroidaceae bacterium]|nr:hypothetical protein [Bacteroidaceae bacterium]
PFGAASADDDNLRIGKAKLVVNNSNAATNLGITLTDTATISNTSGTVALKGIIQGNGVLRKSGAGQLNITYAGTNLWSATILQAGTLAMGAWNTTFGKATSPIHVTGNSAIVMFDNNSSSAVPSVQNAITIDAGKTLTFNAGSRCTVKGSLLGDGTYKISFPYVRGDVYTNCSKFEGTYEVASGQWRLRQAIDLSKATVKLGAGVYAAGYSSDKNEGTFTHKIGALSSTATDCTLSTGTWNVGYLGTDATYAGVFNGSAVMNKYGDGRLTLTGASAGTLNIYQGTVEAKNTAAPITTGTISVRSGGTLEGTGQVQSVTVASGGTLGAGRGTSLMVGTLTVKGSLTMSAGAILRLRTRSSSVTTTSDAFKVAGSVKLTSPRIVISAIDAEQTYADDAELSVFTGTGSVSISGDVTIEPSVPKAGYKWDISTLTTDGKIRVVADPTAIDDVHVDGTKNVNGIYDLSGRPVVNTVRHGVYIVNGRKEKRF